MFNIPNITDDSFINLVKGCQNLWEINIEYCYSLTDTSLFSIADNCPNLGFITLSFDGVNITKVGLNELLNKCPKLIEISSDENYIPKEIRQQLKKRN